MVLPVSVTPVQIGAVLVALVVSLFILRVVASLAITAMKILAVIAILWIIASILGLPVPSLPFKLPF